MIVTVGAGFALLHGLRALGRRSSGQHEALGTRAGTIEATIVRLDGQADGLQIRFAQQTRSIEALTSDRWPDG